MKGLGRLLAGLAIAVALGLAVGAAVAWHDGYRMYAVRTGSMTPTYPTGALVIDAPASSATPAVGDVITFRIASGLVTHRIHGISSAGYTTKGDANPTPDAWTVPRTSVVGHVIAGAPDVGYLLVFFQQPTGAATVVTSLLALSLLWGLFFPSDEADATETARPDHGPIPGGPTTLRHAAAPAPAGVARGRAATTGARAVAGRGGIMRS
jgi:signal peptidase